jgi:hypothetical protein
MLAAAAPRKAKGRCIFRTTVPCAVCNVLICTCTCACTCVPLSRRDEPYAPRAGLPWSHCWRSGSFCLLRAAHGSHSCSRRVQNRMLPAVPSMLFMLAGCPQLLAHRPTSWASCDTMMCKKRARARDLGSAAAALESSSASSLDAWEMFIS